MKRLLSERVSQFQTSVAGKELHTHLAAVDEKGDGSTTHDNGHSHLVKGGEVQPAGPDSHKHELIPAEVQRGIREPSSQSLTRYMRRAGRFPSTNVILLKMKESLREWPNDCASE